MKSAEAFPTSVEQAKPKPLARGREASQWQLAWRRLWQNPMALIGLGGFGLLLCLTLLAPLLAPFSPTSMDLDHLLEPPGGLHLFGTDDLGRDVFSRVLWGGRESLRVGMLGITIAAAGGTVLGLVAGYFGRAVDAVLMRLVDILLSFPTILLVLSIVAALGSSLSTVLIALGISSIPGFSRMVRGSVLSTKHREYVTAARAVGASNPHIMIVHILPNIVAPLIVYASLGLGFAIVLTAGLSYIGLGAQPPSPEWGAMLNYGRGYLRDAWWTSVFPGLAIFVAVLSVNLLGDGIREALDPMSQDAR